MSQPARPVRLLEAAGTVGDCLRAASAERGVLEPPSFARLRQRRQQRARLQRGLGLLAAAVLTFVAAWWIGPAEHAPSIRAESVAVAAAPPDPATAVESAPAAAPSSAEPAKARSIPKPRPRRALGVPPPAESSTPASRSGNAKACAELASAGATEPALDCYSRLANGSGISAELALFEQARLEGKVLRQPARALKTLELYRQRFPAGSLRAEVMLAQIDWLVTTGDNQRARELVVEALSSGLLRERSAELERMRRRLQQTSDD